MRTKGAKDVNGPRLHYEPIECCNTCLFFKKIPQIAASGAGWCRRFPKHEQAESSFWCGEWKSLEDVG